MCVKKTNKTKKNKKKERKRKPGGCELTQDVRLHGCSLQFLVWCRLPGAGRGELLHQRNNFHRGRSVLRGSPRPRWRVLGSHDLLQELESVRGGDGPELAQLLLHGVHRIELPLRGHHHIVPARRMSTTFLNLNIMITYFILNRSLCLSGFPMLQLS